MIWLSLTNTVSDNKIQISILILRRGALSSGPWWWWRRWWRRWWYWLMDSMRRSESDREVGASQGLLALFRKYEEEFFPSLQNFEKILGGVFPLFTEFWMKQFVDEQVKSYHIYYSDYWSIMTRASVMCTNLHHGNKCRTEHLKIYSDLFLIYYIHWTWKNGGLGLRLRHIMREGYRLTKVNFVHVSPQIPLLWSNIRLLV